MWRLGPMFFQNKYPFYLAHHVFFSSHVKRVTLGPTTIKLENQFSIFWCCDLRQNGFRSPLPRIARSQDSEGLNLKMLGGKKASSHQSSVGSYVLQFLEPLIRTVHHGIDKQHWAIDWTSTHFSTSTFGLPCTPTWPSHYKSKLHTLPIPTAEHTRLFFLHCFPCLPDSFVLH
jgi:hypothetical protein